MLIRSARADDGLAIAEVWLRSRYASVPAIPAPVHTDDDVRRYFREIVLPSHDVWVAEEGGRLVAVLVLDGDWIEHLYVDPDNWRAGIGTRLLELAKREQPDGLQLWTFQANARARQFYERHGFVASEMTDGENEEGAPDVRYEWRPP